MKIIQKQPNPSGAYPAPQTWDGNPPDGYAIIDLDMTKFYEYNGFVTLTIEQMEVGAIPTINEDGEEVNEPIYADTVTAYTPNVEAWEAWKAEQPEPAPPEPTMEERVTELEAQIIQADETAIYLFEAQMAQEEINTAQDDALIELYEMIGGL